MSTFLTQLFALYMNSDTAYTWIMFLTLGCALAAMLLTLVPLKAQSWVTRANDNGRMIGVYMLGMTLFWFPLINLILLVLSAVFLLGLIHQHVITRRVSI